MKYLLLIIISLSFFDNYGQDHWIKTNKGCNVHNPTPLKNESIEWTGNCESGFASGKGTLTWYQNNKITGDYYTGTMKEGKPDSDGFYKIKDKLFTGEFTNGEIISGSLILLDKMDTLSHYEGSFCNYNPCGEGVMIHSYGVFTGTFECNYYKNGTLSIPDLELTIESDNWDYYIPISGTITWHDNTKYVGQIKDFWPHGIGTKTYSDGTIKKGKWKKGVFKKSL